MPVPSPSLYVPAAIALPFGAVRPRGGSPGVGCQQAFARLDSLQCWSLIWLKAYAVAYNSLKGRSVMESTPHEECVQPVHAPERKKNDYRPHKSPRSRKLRPKTARILFESQPVQP